MSAQALILKAQASGVALRLVGGKVKASGPREAVENLLMPLREHREALATALQDSPKHWQALDAAYLAHHFSCAACIAAGRGSRYGLRCGVGAALWRVYSQLEPPS